MNGPARQGKPVQFKIEWAGTWNNFDFDCGNFEQPPMYYNPRDQAVTCTYPLEGMFFARAALYYQATPPYYLQDRFCTSRGEDTARLYYMAGRLDVAATPIKDWKLKVGPTAQARIP